MIEQTRAPQQELTTPPTSLSIVENSSFSLNERSLLRVGSLNEIYEDTKRIEVLTLFYLHVDWELVNFEEAVQNKKWRDTMIEEIKAIEKNDMWELIWLPEGHKYFMLICCTKQRKIPRERLKDINQNGHKMI